MAAAADNVDWLTFVLTSHLVLHALPGNDMTWETRSESQFRLDVNHTVCFLDRSHSHVAIDGCSRLYSAGLSLPSCCCVSFTRPRQAAGERRQDK